MQVHSLLCGEYAISCICPKGSSLDLKEPQLLSRGTLLSASSWRRGLITSTLKGKLLHWKEQWIRFKGRGLRTSWASYQVCDLVSLSPSPSPFHLQTEAARRPRGDNVSPRGTPVAIFKAHTLTGGTLPTP